MIGGRSGTGSYNYLLNLVRAIDAHIPDRLTAVLFAGLDVADHEIAPFRASSSVEVVQTAAFNSGRDRFRLTQSLLFGADREAARIFADRRIDVAFETAMFYGWQFPVPVVAWLPDFQHRHLRHLFGPGAYWKREFGFRAQTGSRRLVMLSSEDSRNDCETFYKSARARTAVVRFAVEVDRTLLATDPSGVAQGYRLPERFFYLPNQYWKHKNHGVVIRALQLLRERGQGVVVATSGKAGDPRNPLYFSDLQAQVSSLGLTETFRFLGLIPRAHVIALMRACTALINPSLFEGWSTPVEEARSLGVPLLLSDLRVHREQMGDAACYFNADSAEALADLMASHPAVTASERREQERTALADAERGVRQYCLEFLAAVERAVQLHVEGVR